ncbi:hypothetical protein L1987_60657 [Smallanthus sonchifolius]|uniref:Uncharacterized protein n=1 Tax=Smallanthus sonchifolius TaxID=185202 RepID=A0ACB9D8J9_9ASTR|nr:hypothetical protein L1987_60657 [Smallanthus sonchifolius]
MRPVASSFTPVLQLLDSGNLVIRDDARNKTIFWESFDFPTDTLLPDLKLGWKLDVGLHRFITSWKSSEDPSEELYFKYEVLDESILSRFVISPVGLLQYFTWKANSSKEWNLLVTFNSDPCDNYANCGHYGICYSLSSCKCLSGFTPDSPRDWGLFSYSGGCRRKHELNCGHGDGFVKYNALKLPDNPIVWGNYTNHNFPDGGEQIYIRMAHDELQSIAGAKRKRVTVKIVSVVTVIGILLLFGGAIWYLGWIVRHRRKDQIGRNSKAQQSGSFQYVEDNQDSGFQLPLYDLETIFLACNNFSERNKIGQGGFGSVYKHRNLVKLLGCCIEGEETMLVYEYLLNKSLNNFIYGTYYSLSKKYDVMSLNKNQKDLQGPNGRIRGYMSPEYAMNGHYSVKSDVYSFGVIVLEIISGYKNWAFHHHDHDLNLLGHAYASAFKSFLLSVAGMVGSDMDALERKTTIGDTSPCYYLVSEVVLPNNVRRDLRSMIRIFLFYDLLFFIVSITDLINLLCHLYGGDNLCGDMVKRVNLINNVPTTGIQLKHTDSMVSTTANSDCVAASVNGATRRKNEKKRKRAESEEFRKKAVGEEKFGGESNKQKL